MATSKSLIALAVLVAAVSASNVCTKWGSALKSDIAGADGWMAPTKEACLKSCEDNPSCQAAQTCKDTWLGWSNCQFNYGGVISNCYTYTNQNDNQPQLTPSTPNCQGYFVIYKLTRYNCNVGTWSHAIYRDIDGTGISGGSTVDNIAACKKRCVDDSTCQAAQYSSSNNYHGLNCFIYATQAIDRFNAPATTGFYIYKYNRVGCTWNCCPDLVTTGVCNCGSLQGCCSDHKTPKVSIGSNGQTVYGNARCADLDGPSVCPPNMINPSSCGCGVYTTTNGQGCTVTACRPNCPQDTYVNKGMSFSNDKYLGDLYGMTFATCKTYCTNWQAWCPGIQNNLGNHVVTASCTRQCGGFSLHSDPTHCTLFMAGSNRRPSSSTTYYEKQTGGDNGGWDDFRRLTPDATIVTV